MRKLTVLLAVAAASALIALPQRALAQDAAAQESQFQRAVCVVMPTQGNRCRGIVQFTTGNDGKVTVQARVAGLNANQKHAIHVHEFGDISDMSGQSAGGHYNPEEHPHGLPPADERHAGDFGNLEANAQGEANFQLTVDNISLGGKNSIIGRAIIVHALPDDGGQPTGNAGDRIGFGVIGIAKPMEQRSE